MQRCQVLVIAILAAVVLVIRPAVADDIVSSWTTMKLPPPPQLNPVTVDPAHTTLLVLDFSTDTCNPKARPRCFDSLPVVEKLLMAARAHHASVVFSTVPHGSIRNSPPALAPHADEPVVSAGADKFLDTELSNILKANNAHTVIVTGTTAQGAVLYTASSAALRGYTVVVPVDGMSAADPFGELATAWIFANGPPSVSKHITLTRSTMIAY
jgi:nicotinamidase-related amidase